MRLLFVSLLCFLSADLYAQQISSHQVQGTAATLNPEGAQTITQPKVSQAQSTFGVNSLNGVLEATLFPGKDIGEKISEAYRELPATGGKITINIPASGLAFSTPVLFATRGKPVLLDCLSDQAVSKGLIYTGTGSAFTFNIGGPTATGQGSGVQNCTINGPNTVGVTGITWGGENGAVGVVIRDSTIYRFDPDMDYVANSFNTLAKNVHISALANRLGTCLRIAGNENSGEQITFENVQFDGCYGSAMMNGDGGVKISGGGVHANFIATSFDDVTVVDNSAGTYFYSPHFENPGRDFYVFYTKTAGNAVMNNPVFASDDVCKSKCPDALIHLSGGTLSMTGFSSFSSVPYVALSGAANLMSLAPAAVGPSFPVSTHPVLGTTTGHFFWDEGQQVGSSGQSITNHLFAVNGPGLFATTDQFNRWGALLDGGTTNSASPRLYVSRTPNLVDTLSGKITLEDETTSCSGFGTGLSLWTQLGGHGSGDHSSRAATLDCHGDLHLKGGLFVGDSDDGVQGFTGTCPPNSTLRIKGGIVVGCN